MNWSTIAALCLIAVGGFFALGGKLPSPSTPETPTVAVVAYPAPTQAELLAAAEPLKEYRGKKNAGLAAKLYFDFSDVLARDSTIVKTTGQFREAHKRAQSLAFAGTDVAGSLPGSSTKIDAVLSRWIGLEDGPLDRQKAIDACKAVAWGLGGQ